MIVLKNEKEKQVLKPGGVSVSIVHEPIQKVKGIKSGFFIA